MPLFMMAPFWEDAGVRGGETDRQRRRQGDSDGETETGPEKDGHQRQRETETEKDGHQRQKQGQKNRETDREVERQK